MTTLNLKKTIASLNIWYGSKVQTSKGIATVQGIAIHEGGAELLLKWDGCKVQEWWMQTEVTPITEATQKPQLSTIWFGTRVVDKNGRTGTVAGMYLQGKTWKAQVIWDNDTEHTTFWQLLMFKSWKVSELGVIETPKKATKKARKTSKKAA